jgi:hydrogenase nickel incorporation protein HypA/HybF
MHEASIILNVLDIAFENCQKEGYDTVDSITLKVGKASGVMLDALYFAFESAKYDTLASAAVLEIIEVPVGGRCDACESDFTVEEKFVFACPLCGSTDNFTVTSGRELDIVELEVS